MTAVPVRTPKAIDRLALLETAVADMARRLSVLEGRKRPADADADARLLGAIASYIGGAVFAAADLISGHDAELVAALDGMDGRTLGAWLKRLRRHTTGPYRLTRVGRDEAGALWRLTVSGVSHTAAAGAADRASQLNS